MKSLLQSKIWAEFKARHGWRAYKVAGIYVLERQLPLGLKFLYAPEIDLIKDEVLPLLCTSTNDASLLSSSSRNLAKRGSTSGISIQSSSRFPMSDCVRLENDTMVKYNNSKVFNELKDFAIARRAMVLRLEFLNEWDDGVAIELERLGLRKAFEEIQPEFRRVIDIRPSLSQILAQMKPKGRYNIRVAERHGVKVETTTDPEIFLRLFKETASRDKFSIRSDDYYRDIINMVIENNLGVVLVASLKNQPLSAGIFTFYDGVATYLYGASSSEKREAMAPYALHFEAIKLAKARGCHTYDLLAVASEIRRQNTEDRIQKRIDAEQGGISDQKSDDSGQAGKYTNPSSVIRHPSSDKYAGITRFKEQFGGRTVHLLGSWDMVIKPVAYTVFAWAEKMRRKL